MMNSHLVLAIDLGTSGPKAAVVAADGRTAGTARRSVQTIRTSDGGVEQDPDDIWDAVVLAAEEALHVARVSPSQIEAVICSSQYSSIVAVDAHGATIGNMILWQDQRGAAKNLGRISDFPSRADTPQDLVRWLRVHGLPPIAGGISLTHMRFLKFARPEVYDRAATLLEPMDFLALRFTGRAATNQCSALMSLMTDNRTLTATGYHAGLVKASLIDPEKLPEMLPMDATVGTLLPAVADRLGLRPSTPVITGLNDTQAGAIGAGAFSGTHGAVSLGSTAVLVSHVDFKKTDIRNAILSMPSPVPNTYFIMAENGMAGANVERFLTNCVFNDDEFSTGTAPTPNYRFERFERAAQSVPVGSDGLIFMPWLGGSMAPSADDNMRGGFINMSTSTTRSHMARAILEAMALNLRWVRDPAQRFAKRDFTHFMTYGGGAQSNWTCQIMADVLGAPVHQLADGDHTVCIGAGMLAHQRLGNVTFDDIAETVRVKKVFEPISAHRDIYDGLFPQFVAAFKANRPLVKKANRAVHPASER